MERKMILVFNVLLFANMAYSVPPVYPPELGPGLPPELPGLPPGLPPGVDMLPPDLLIAQPEPPPKQNIKHTGGVPPSECRSLMDLVLVIDGSDSISAGDYAKQRIAIQALIEELHLGPNKAQVGFVVYSSSIAQVQPITYNREELKKASRNMVHPRDGTNTTAGIETAIQLFQKNGRKNVPWTCIVITDGLSKNPPATAEMAAAAKAAGINMFAVGISSFIEQTELEAIASNPKQVLMLKTFDQLRMSLSKLMKVVCPCPPLPPLPYGLFDNGTRSIGSIRIASCLDGYQPMGDPTVECLKDSTWSPLTFSCLECPPPKKKFGNGMISNGANTLNSVREYICKTGYTTPEPILTTCLPGPSGPAWTVPSITCKACPPLPPITNGYIEAPVTDIMIGTVLAYHCNPKFIQTGPIETTCVDKKGIPYWKKPVHSCIACGPPPSVPFADVDTTGDTLVNSVRVYTCKYGFHPTGPIEAICMGDKGATYWQLTNHTCRACDKPPMLANADLVPGGDSLVGSVRTYLCKKGFQETGVLEAVCTANHGVTSWDGPHNLCIPCGPPPQIPNAIMDPTGDSLLGSIRTYKCMNKYIATGPIEVGCIRGTGGPIWTSPEFQCITCPPPPSIPYTKLVPKGDNFVGHKRKYQCIKGFVTAKPGPIEIECIGEYLNNRGRAFWSPPSNECIACPEPPPMDFADLDAGDYTVGSKRRYRCHKGFYATGPIIIKCLKTAQWSTPDHSCTACGPTPDVPNADVQPGLHTLGAKRTYVCHHGLVPDGPPKIKCLKGAKWSPVNFSCVGCKEPYKVDFAVLEPGKNTVDAIRRYTCLPGYYATGQITTTCAVPPKSKIPDWSTPVHFCKDCGDPYPVLNAKPLKGPRTIGSKQLYKCNKGFVPSGPPVSHCMQNGEWTLPDFKCITCGNPPPVEHAAVDKVGTNQLFSVRAYTCITGFIATGPIEAKCVEDKPYGVPYWIMLTDNNCTDCGLPPNVSNAYASLGPSTIGSEKKYSCIDGYDMKGMGKIKCLSTGLWSVPDFSCMVQTTTTTTTPAPVPNDPSVCDNCRMENGVGFMNHPYDCSQFVQCHFSTRGGIQAYYRFCPFGQYWDQGDLTCKPADDVDCPHEKCMTRNLHSYKHSDSNKCCAYWECVNGKSKAKCCGAGFRYISGKGCEPDDKCDDECPWEDMFPSCDKRPMHNMAWYEQYVSNGAWIKMPCAPGTAFSIIDCECSLATDIIPGYVCRPEVHLNFDDDDTDDDSGRNVYILNDGVRVHRGAAYFDGNSRLLINRFSNTAFHGDLVIKLRYNEDRDGPTAHALQALVTNGDCGDDPSIIIAKMKGYVMCGAKTHRPKSFALPTTEKEWKEVIYIHNEKKLEGKVCGAAYSKWCQGPIKSTHCGLQIGYGTKLANFVGYMDDISVYQCRPPENILNVYGGRRRAQGSSLSMKIH
ncbi:sushi, von Willebrand factor type A, EGF and pentraxin domain-containing protein 1-like [Ruditapes philippinarum]|uniref:sushi, von Willebrand factor type A, EGF and pentraxin domain-containing protein 1-like n=1 Tax=Ruditapes philippinarum TaxID=129788 RepID=UPI00295B4A54|nr:sushi, von Willebrand factor type A, EGF and pentraxin domain-containing protein 1-like [Ruditapes philippinarum]XP_060590418.1 sushi, von Willebrand factor type A, EGF and pentraxin domain-containing protein 1-like [Ruditapes philippinarum]